MTDLYPMAPLEWRTVVARCLLGSTVKGVAHACANYAGPQGQDVRPGIALLAKDAEMGERTVELALARLREVGLLKRVKCGSNQGRRAQADVYQLTHPGLEELERRVPMWDPKREKVWFAGVEVAPPEPKKRASRKKKKDASAVDETAGSPAGLTGDKPVDNSSSPAGVTGDDPPENPLLAGNHPQEITGTPAGDNRNTRRSYALPSHRPSQLPSHNSNAGDHGAEVEGSPTEPGEPSASDGLQRDGPAFDIKTASAFLLTLGEGRMASAVERATTDLGPEAERPQVLILAAELARKGALT